MVILATLGIALVAAVGIRRTSTDQIDRLVDEFLEKTLLERLQKWCNAKGETKNPFVFNRVELTEPPAGRSYAHFDFYEKDVQTPRHVGVKMNVFNYEIFTTLPLLLPDDLSGRTELGHHLIDKVSLEKPRTHEVLRHFMGSLQGSVEEGYTVRVSFGQPRHTAIGTRVDALFSFRIKLKENFLTSPFLKRYFSEDAAILVNELFNEWNASGFAMPPQ